MIELTASLVLGKPNLFEGVPNEVVAYKLFNAYGGGCIVDTVHNRLYVVDGGNNRVLGLDLNTALAAASPVSADIVLGQPDFVTSAGNGDSNFNNYPLDSTPTAKTLRMVDTAQQSLSEAFYPITMLFESGVLWLLDANNNRVVKFTNPWAMDPAVADVWGQADMLHGIANRGGSIAANSLSTYKGGGVAKDADGNLWVADSYNERVVKYPVSGGVISKTATVVIGQTSLTSGSPGEGASGLDKFNFPVGLCFGPDGKLYVADQENYRVMVFTPPFTNGMSGAVFMHLSPIDGNAHDIRGVTLDPQGGGVWVTSGGCYVGLYGFDGTLIKYVKTFYNNAWYFPMGSIGFDSSYNMYVAAYCGGGGSDVFVFAPPYTPYNVAPVKALFSPPFTDNLPTARSLGSGMGVAAAHDQLIVNNFYDLRFWNDLDSLFTYKPADGVVVPGSAATDYITKSYPIYALKVSDDHVYICILAGIPHQLMAFDLPMTAGMPVSHYIETPVYALNDPSHYIALGAHYGLCPTADDSFLWVSQRDYNRVVRIRNPLTDPKIDIVLGQRDFASTAPNQGGAMSKYTLSSPGKISIDREGNLWVADHALEDAGNKRMLMWRAADIPVNNTSVVFDIPAYKEIDTVSGNRAAAFDMAFNSDNVMVVVFNGMDGIHHAAVYLDPTAAGDGPNTPDFYTKEWGSELYGACFDSHDNLYVSDLMRARVLVYRDLAWVPPAGTIAEELQNVEDAIATLKVEVGNVREDVGNVRRDLGKVGI